MRPGAWATSQTTTYAQDSVGERRVRAALDSLTDSGAVVLHDRQVPNTRGNIDHVVIAASGVWIIDARNWEGRVQRRWVGRRAGRVLFVDGHNRMDAVDKLAWQIQAVRAALTPIGFADAPVTGVLCFTGATWGLLARPLRFGNADRHLARQARHRNLRRTACRLGADRPGRPAAALDAPRNPLKSVGNRTLAEFR